ncbi:MAG TPA: hypothetical protein EYQ30_13945 [Gammaproteobacteria bacterium]|nr:hypothetical protein [Gammaproteobacteria bacterium]
MNQNLNRPASFSCADMGKVVPARAIMAVLGFMTGMVMAGIGSSAGAQTNGPDEVTAATNNAADSRNAAEFRLFESVDSADSPGNARVRRNRSSAAARNTASTPEFTLVGTSRIGDSYRVILAHRGGESVVIRARPDATTRINGYSQYAIVNIAAGRVSLNFPDSAPCVEFEDLGVSCDAATNIAELTLTNAAPLAPSQRVQSQQRQQAQQTAASGETAPDQAPPNPFAALSAAAAENAANNPGATDGSDDSNRFRPRRIPPEDVPPGMRVVSTPFGDRLVDQ